jgi:hypothetical protein
MWRHFFAVLSAVMVLFFISRVIRNTSGKNGPITEAEIRAARMSASERAEAVASEKLVAYVMVGAGLASALFFFIDSMRRTYRTGNTVAIAIAFMGFITLGMASLIYYAIWGREPLRPAAELYGDGVFCERCLARSSDRAAPSTLTFNGFFGTQPMGVADRCPQCTSVVRTIWIWFGVPLLPVGSYRMIATGKNEYVGRRTSVRWSQVLPVYAMALLFIWAISHVMF